MVGSALGHHPETPAVGAWPSVRLDPESRVLLVATAGGLSVWLLQRNPLPGGDPVPSADAS